MKKYIYIVLPILLLITSCKATFNSNKLSEYDKKIDGELSVYIAYVSSKEKDKIFEEMKKKLIERFSEKGIKADVTILKADNEFSFILKKEEIKTNNPNGLTLLIQETDIYTYTKGNYQYSKFAVTLTDHLLDKDVWKTEMTFQYKNVLGGLNKAAGTYTNALIRTLEKDGLLNK